MQKANTPPVVIPDNEYESETPVREHTYDPYPYEEYVDPVRNYVSPKEYSELPQDKREDMALGKYDYIYKFKNKSNEEIGRDYERFIACKYTRMGYRVISRGILLGKSDGGIDLIARKEHEILLIQCKYWGRGKIIHENCVTKLDGSSHLYQLENQCEREDVTPVLVTNISLDYVAKQKADLLGVSYVERCFMTDYPRVKCCTFRGRNGQEIKLYFLPFDEAYDYVDIESEKTFYAFSVAEAVYRGFHRDC